MQSLAAPLYASFKATGCIALARRLFKGGLVLCYHNVVAERGAPPIGDPGLHMRVGRFRDQMQWLAATYKVVSLADFLARMIAAKSLRRVATITFDDAYAGFFMTALPVLRELALPATVFIVAAAAERREPFWWDQPGVQSLATPAGRAQWLGALQGDGDMILRQLGVGARAALPDEYLPADWNTLAAACRSGVVLGVHSDTHRALTRLADAELRRELLASRDIIRLRTGIEPLFFAHPYGLWDARVRDSVRAAGYRAACTLDYGLVDPGADLWALPRVNVPATISSAAFQAWSAGLSLRRFFPR